MIIYEDGINIKSQMENLDNSNHFLLNSVFFSGILEMLKLLCRRWDTVKENEYSLNSFFKVYDKKITELISKGSDQKI